MAIKVPAARIPKITIGGVPPGLTGVVSVRRGGTPPAALPTTGGVQFGGARRVGLLAAGLPEGGLPGPNWTVQELIAYFQTATMFANWLAGFFSGKPKLEDTQQAIQRLMQSGLWQFQALARNLQIWLKNGVPLSTSNPQLQAQLRGWIHGALSSLGLTASQQLQLDTILWRVLASETALSGSFLDRIVQAFLSLNQRVPAPPPPPPKRKPAAKPVGIGLPVPRVQPGATRAPVPAARSVPQGDIVSYLETFAAQHPYLQLGGCIGLALAGQEGLAAACLEELLAAQVGKEAKTLLANTTSYLNYLLGRQPASTPSRPPQPTPQPSTVPTLNQTKPCPECEQGLTAGQRAQLQEIRAQQKQVSQELQTEEGQQLEQQLSQQEQELTQLQELETQPASTRNITQEIQQKEQIQQQLGQELQEWQGQPSGQPAQTPPGTVPTLQGNQVAQQIESQVTAIEAAKKVGVQFCVGCTSPEDAILFLNGEPSACSVVPGSTKELQVDG